MRQSEREGISVGVVGTGYVARHFILASRHYPDLKISRVLTRRKLDHCAGFPDADLLTHSLEDLLEHCDVVFECTGDPVYATDVIDAACKAARPVVTMNAEFHVTAGSYFVSKGLVTESEGDQPGSLAALRERALEMGFRPIVYGNMKAFLNLDPSLAEMEYWSAKNGITLPKVTSFTDGTKLQIEQALVANGCGATIARTGLLGLQTDDVEAGGKLLAEEARHLRAPISDYLLFRSAPHGVFIVAEHDGEHSDFLRHMKMGNGPYYVLTRTDVLVHLEVPRTIFRLVREGRVLLDNSAVPTISVAAIAKSRLSPGMAIGQGIGSFEVRGEAVRIADHPGALPVGLLSSAVVTRPVDSGAMLTFDDVDLPDTLALKAWQDTERRSLAAAGLRPVTLKHAVGEYDLAGNQPGARVPALETLERITTAMPLHGAIS